MVMQLDTGTQPDQRRLRTVFGAVPTSVVAVCAVVAGAPAGMVFSTFTAVSLDPPLVSLCVNRTSGTWPLLRCSPRLGLTVLADPHGHLPRQLAGPREHRFTGVDLRYGAGGAVLIEGGAAWLECSPHAAYPAGDHELVLLEVRALDTDPAATPLLYRHSSIRPL
jgi:flavin reductase (DIM6/NTAB) family NADH-FMN oxidoreductase RutF